MNRPVKLAAVLGAGAVLMWTVTACEPPKAAVEASPSTAPVFTYTVNAAKGSDANRGSSAAPFKTITHALSVAVSGIWIRVLPGTYDGTNGEVFPLNVPAGVVLIGDEANKGAGTVPTIVQGSGVVAGVLEATIVPGAVSTVAGFQVAGLVPAPANDSDLVYLAANNVTLRNNTLIGGNFNGIDIAGSSNHRISGNFVQSNAWAGLQFTFSGSGTRVESNTFTLNQFGVEFDAIGGDLGGGGTGSAGGNRIFCNSGYDVGTSLAAGSFSAQNNTWDHAPLTSSTANPPPAGTDLYEPSAATFDTTGASVVANPCP